MATENPAIYAHFSDFLYAIDTKDIHPYRIDDILRVCDSIYKLRTTRVEYPLKRSGTGFFFNFDIIETVGPLHDRYVKEYIQGRDTHFHLTFHNNPGNSQTHFRCMGQELTLTYIEDRKGLLRPDIRYDEFSRFELD